MKVTSFASSSSGNLYTLESGSTNLILECGLTPTILKQKLSFNINGFDACLVSHHHKDHSKSIDVILNYGLPVYAHKETFKDFNTDGLKAKFIEANQVFKIGELDIKAFETQHDCLGSLGFFIMNKSTGERLIFATDTYFLKQKFPALDYIMIECNYVDALLDKDYNCGNASRIRKSHFSLNNLKLWLSRQDLSKLKKLYVLHLSDSHSDASLIQKELEKMTFADVIICEKGL